MTVKDLRAAPGREGAELRADAAALRECAERLDALAAGLPEQRMPDWADNVLMTLAERCRVAAADLETVAVLSDAGLDGDDEPDAYDEFDAVDEDEGRGWGRCIFALPKPPIPPLPSVITRRTN